MSLELLLISQVNSTFPTGLRGDGKTEIKQIFIFDLYCLYPKQNLVNSVKINKLKT